MWLLWKACFPSKKRNLTSPCYTGIFSRAPWKEKCYDRSSLSIGVDALDHFFYLLPCQSLSLSLLLLQSTKRSAFSLRFHEHDDDLVDEVEDVEDTFEQPLDVQFPYSILYYNRRFKVLKSDPSKANPLSMVNRWGGIR